MARELESALDRLASATTRQRIREEDAVRESRNGHDPRRVWSLVHNLQRKAAAIERRIP